MSGCSDATKPNDDTDTGDVGSDGGFRANCGDGQVDSDEECDDGNDNNDDVCRNDCTWTETTGLCATDHGGCDPLTTCTDNADGTVICGDCPAGYSGTGAEGCVDINECDGANPCGRGTCSNLPGSYACDCDAGYQLDEDEIVCVDIDECGDDASLCGNGTCENTAGSYLCDCPWPEVEGEGTCLLCPADGALTLAFSADRCEAFGGESTDELLALAQDNLRAVLNGAADAVQFLDASSIVERIRDCAPGDEACADPLGLDELGQLADDVADAFGEEILASDTISASDACSVTLTPSPEDLCGDRAPDSCDPQGEDCPYNMVCNPENSQCQPMSCQSSTECGPGWTCAGTCQRAFCETDADCGDSGDYCLEGACADYCPFVDTPLWITLWHAGDGDVYAEVGVGAGESAVNFADARLFDDQVALILDVARAVEALELLVESDRFADEGAASFLPDPADVGGQVELELTELAEGDYALRVNLRNDAGGDLTGLHAVWVLEDAFDSYPNETPLPVVLDLAQTCPLALVRADDANDTLSIGLHMSPSEVVLPFGFMANNPIFGGDGGAPQEECLDCPCYDDVGLVIDCPCFNDDGQPVDCDSGDVVPCPFDEFGDQDDCLPYVGSVKLQLGGPHLRASLRLAEGEDDVVTIAGLGLGDSATVMSRDFGDESWLSWAAVALNPDFDYRALQPDLRIPSDTDGVIVTLREALSLELDLALGVMSDRIIDPPSFMLDDEMRLELTGIDGDGPDFRLRIVPQAVRPAELVAGLLTMSSSWLASTEFPPRTPPGTVTVEAGQCLVVSPTADDNAHPFEALEARACPTAHAVAADATVDSLTPAIAQGSGETLIVRGGQSEARVLLRVNASSLPSNASEVRLELFHDNTDVALLDDFDIYEVTEAWSEGTVTWDTGPGYAESPVISRTVEEADGDRGTWWSFDITDLVDAWQGAPGDNHGLILLSEGQLDEVRFLSSEAQDTRRRPRVLVFP